MYKLEDIFETALKDYSTRILDGEGYQARLLFGIKIIKDGETNKIQIFNTAKGGDYYQEASPDEYAVFYNEGYRAGVYYMAKRNYKFKLNVLERKIKAEMNGKKNLKTIEFLKDNRLRLLNNYYNITQKQSKNEKTKNN